MVQIEAQWISSCVNRQPGESDDNIRRAFQIVKVIPPARTAIGMTAPYPWTGLGLTIRKSPLLIECDHTPSSKGSAYEKWASIPGEIFSHRRAKGWVWQASPML